MKLPWNWLGGTALLGFNGWALTCLLWPVLKHWLEDEQARNLAIALAGLVIVTPPAWLSQKMKRRRIWFQRYLVIFNVLLASALAYYGWRTPPPPRPAPTPEVSSTPRPAPTPGHTRSYRPHPVRPTPQASLTPSPLVSPTPLPETSLTPQPEPAPEAETPMLDPAEATKRYAAVDQYALSTPAEKEKDVDTLGAYLSAPWSSDEEKIRAIYRWVTDRISYDAKAFYSGELPDPSAPVTLRRRTAVCGGYAVLVDELGKAAGLKIEEVDGYASGAGADPARKENHAWNAVKLPGGWRLLDATWGAGDLGDDQQFHKRFKEFFFLTPPDRMLVTHFPSEPKWQLSLPPITREEFLRRPKRRPEYFQLGLQVSQLVGELTADPRATLDFQAPKGLYLDAELLSDKQRQIKGATMVDRDEGRIVVNVLPPVPGQYTLRIFAFRPEAEYGQEVLEYRILARSGQPDGYPQIYKEFQQHSGHVFGPARGRLKPGVQHFELELSGARQVHVGDWDNELHKEGDRFVGDVLVEPGELNVYAVFSGQQGQGIITYQVR
ncbi:MAG: transglutaminase domain-containing protein [Vulcanimicrobiota bacterium]